MLEAVDEQDQLGHWSRSTLTTIFCYGDDGRFNWVLYTWMMSRPLTAPAPALEAMHHSMLAFYQLHYIDTVMIYC